jgi:FixJ family two-component response regulator
MPTRKHHGGGDFSGLELQKRIAVDRIDMPIIFIAGYSVPTVSSSSSRR